MVIVPKKLKMCIKMFSNKNNYNVIDAPITKNSINPKIKNDKKLIHKIIQSLTFLFFINIVLINVIMLITIVVGITIKKFKAIRIRFVIIYMFHNLSL